MSLRLAALAAIAALSCFDCRETGAESLAYGGDGSGCDADYECDSDQCLSGTCVAPSDGLVEIGDGCSRSDECVGDASCEEGYCVAGSDACGASGEACQQDSDCCDTGTCVGNVCGGTLGAGGSGGSGGSGGAGGSGGSGGGGGSSSGCDAIGESCGSDGDCCSGTCEGGSCT
jgi:hypothetical protein